MFVSAGKGVLTYPNGDVYDGLWLDGMRHGKGALTCVLGDSYIGEWANDHPQGLGEMSYRSGQLYNGNWENGLVMFIDQDFFISLLIFLVAPSLWYFN